MTFEGPAIYGIVKADDENQIVHEQGECYALRGFRPEIDEARACCRKHIPLKVWDHADRCHYRPSKPRSRPSRIPRSLRT